ncbi:glycosyl hydrolase [Cellulosimicrobium arenosum]|uniref:Glycoside hydrolase n=1 Tax=Cellulosimicrobium arenosum TaxID=2708133 RepID=A0A927J105_9MICO|nr:glycoside hydrolase [Cellulosimicrobium arenosum]
MAVLVACGLTATLVAPSGADPAGGAGASGVEMGAELPPDVPGFDVGDFENPTDQRPAVLWFWDRAQTEAQVDARLESIHDAGFREVVVFRWDGSLPEEYFSEAWFDRVGHLLERSEELGLKVWLDDDAKFPSGMAGGFVVQGGTVGDRTYEPRPDLAVKTLMSGGTAVREGGTDVPLHDLFGASLSAEEGQVVADASRTPGITLLRDGAHWTDYSLDATFTIRSATAGFMVRSEDPRNGYLVDVRADGQVDFWRQTGGAFVNLRVGSTTRPGWDPATAHDITIRVEGADIDVTLDGVAEPTVTDTAHASGGVGMRVDGPQAWALDDLEVSTVPGGDPLYANDFEDATSITDFDTRSRVLDDVVAVTARPASGEGAQDLDRVVDLTDLYGTDDGTWPAPDGRWRIEAYRSVPRTGDRALYLDSMSVEAQELYLDVVFDEYADRFGEYLGTTLLGFADDEPEVGRHGDDLPPWSPDLAERLEQDGVPVAAAIAAVYGDLGAEGDELRGRFYRAMSDQWADAYWKTKYEWAEAHGVAMISNPLYDEYGPAGRLHESGNLLTMHQWAQVPGTDLIYDHVERGWARSLPREPASVAHQLGRPLVYDELMGATGWSRSIADVRRGTAMSAVRGINKALFHATFDAPGTAPYPPVFSEENAWWQYVPELSEWTGRLMEFGRHTTAAQTAVVQMQRAAEAAQGASSTAQEQSAVDDPFFAAQHSLEDRQVDFDLLDEGALSDDPSILAHAVVTADGRLEVGEMTYSTIVVPTAPVVSLEAVQRLVELVEAGGEVVLAGPAPTREVEGRDDELAAAVLHLVDAGGDRVVVQDEASDAGAAAASLGRAAVVLDDPSTTVRVLRFQEHGSSGYLLLNEGTVTMTTDATFPASGVPALWDFDSGDVRRAPSYVTGEARTTMPLTLEPGVPVGVTISTETGASAHAVHVDGVGTVRSVGPSGGEDEETLGVTVRSDRSGPTVVTATDGSRTFTGAVVTPPLPTERRLDGDWRLELGDGSDAIDRPLRSWDDLAPRYSGDGVYSRAFELTADDLAADWTLDLGRVAHAARVSVNGEEVATLLRAPFRTDVGDALVVGTNTVEVTVTNTDGAERGEGGESGLLGPVALLPFATSGGDLVTSPLRITAATAKTSVTSDRAEVTLTIENDSEEPVTGVPGALGAGWVDGVAVPVTLPAHGEVTAVATARSTGFVPDGDTDLTATFAVGDQLVAARALVLDASFATPPDAALDHVDLGDRDSEAAHALESSPTSGTNVEAGLTRRYGGYRVPDAWYEVDLAVEAGRSFVLQGLETYNDDPQVKGYQVYVGGERVATRENVRDVRREGTEGWRLVVPAELVRSDTVTVRFQSRANPDVADPSLADVWALPADDETPVDVEVEARSRCLAGRAYVAVRAVNADAVPVDVVLETPFGSKTFTGVEVGDSAYQAFSSRASEVPGAVTGVRVTALVDGRSVEQELTASYGATSCG